MIKHVLSFDILFNALLICFSVNESNADVASSSKIILGFCQSFKFEVKKYISCLRLIFIFMLYQKVWFENGLKNEFREAVLVKYINLTIITILIQRTLKLCHKLLPMQDWDRSDRISWRVPAFLPYRKSHFSLLIELISVLWFELTRESAPSN